MKLVQIGEEAYFREMGWRPNEHGFIGKYQTRFGQWWGAIVRDYGNAYSYYIHRPPAELKGHPDGPCFMYHKEDWYRVHFSVEPKDISSGILAIERILNECHLKTRGNHHETN